MTTPQHVQIKDFMTTDIITLNINDTAWTAYQRMKQSDIRHLPVVNGDGQLQGIFSLSDLNRSYSPRETESGWYYDRDDLMELKIQALMIKNVETLRPEDNLQQAAKMMVRSRINGIPIMNSSSGKLEGIITHIDVLKQVSENFI